MVKFKPRVMNNWPPSKISVNDSICIFVAVQNLGHFTETFDVSVNYTFLFDPLIGTQKITLAPGETITLNFNWIPSASGR